jgi:DNA-binding XRE family transcriptional regulator
MRPIPAPILAKARAEIGRLEYDEEPLPFTRLALEFQLHVQTLQRAVRHGRLKATLSTRSAFGRPIYLATRAAVASFIANHSRRNNGGTPSWGSNLPPVPSDYDLQLRVLRHRLQLSQSELATRIGAAQRAVVYQWESRRRTPSAVFWQRVQGLGGPGAEPRLRQNSEEKTRSRGC